MVRWSTLSGFLLSARAFLFSVGLSPVVSISVSVHVATRRGHGGDGGLLPFFLFLFFGFLFSFPSEFFLLFSFESFFFSFLSNSHLFSSFFLSFFNSSFEFLKFGIVLLSGLEVLVDQ